MFACYSLFPQNTWVATLALAAALPPFLLAWVRRRGTPSWRLLLGAVAVILLCQAWAFSDFLRFRDLHRRGELPDGWLLELPLALWNEPGKLYLRAVAVRFLESTAVAFACSALLTLVVGAVLRLLPTGASWAAGDRDGQPAQDRPDTRSTPQQPRT